MDGVVLRLLRVDEAGGSPLLVNEVDHDGHARHVVAVFGEVGPHVALEALLERAEHGALLLRQVARDAQLDVQHPFLDPGVGVFELHLQGDPDEVEGELSDGREVPVLEDLRPRGRRGGDDVRIRGGLGGLDGDTDADGIESVPEPFGQLHGLLPPCVSPSRCDNFFYHFHTCLSMRIKFVLYFFHMFRLAQNSSSVSADPESLQEAAENLAEQTGANVAADTAQQAAQEVALRLPEYLEWIKHVDMLFALGVFAVTLLAFYTFYKDRMASVLLAIPFAYILTLFTPILEWIPQVGNYPFYMIQSVGFLVLTLAIAHGLYRSPFFEPMNVPTGTEIFFFSVVTTGLFIMLGVQWWPVEDPEAFSQAFRFIFLNSVSQIIWSLSPVALAFFIRGKF